MNNQRTIDHLVYVVTDLQQGMQTIEALLGCPVIYGGQHLSQGTHNALVNLGNGCYLELLAIDPANTSITSPRWMGVDVFDVPQLSRWALKSNQLEQDAAILQQTNPAMGCIENGSRQRTDGSNLTWGIIMPLPQPTIELLPFMVDWKDSVHPTADLEEHCQLISMQATHPSPTHIQKTLNQLNAPLQVSQGDNICLQAIIDCPRGRVVL